MKLTNSLLTTILGNKHEFSFEERFTLACILYAGSVCFISIFGNIQINLGIGSVLTVTLSFLIYTVCFVLGRFYKKTNLARILFSAYTLIFCNIYWLTNYGSRGSALILFLIYFSMMVFIWRNLYLNIIWVLITLNIVALFFIENAYPNLIPQYPSEWVRISDVYISLIIYLGLFSILTVSAKNNYIEQYKKAQKADELKSSFLANMSHEIRTPLNAIMGFSELLARRELPQEKKEQYSFLIKDNGKYLMKLVSDILDISLLESGQLDINIEKIDLNSLMNKIYFNFHHSMKTMKKKEVKLVLNIPPDSLIIESDVTRIEQIIVNLVSNAIKFTNEGYIIFGYQKQGDFVLFFVEDTGRGIKDELKPEIFNRFIKNEESYDNKFERGAGIGLSLAKELTQVLDGKIWFTSEYMKGSTFYFSLPLQKAVLANGKK